MLSESDYKIIRPLSDFYEDVQKFHGLDDNEVNVDTIVLCATIEKVFGSLIEELRQLDETLIAMKAKLKGEE